MNPSLSRNQHFVFQARPEVAFDYRLAEFLDAVRYIIPIEDQFLAVIADATNQQMNVVMMIGGMVVDGGPFQLGPEVAFHAGHDFTDMFTQIDTVMVIG